MNSKALLGALGGAIVGALIWAAISYFTGYEVGYVAWGIGILVGGGAKALGSNDKATAVACALLALGSIFVGKVMAIEFLVGDVVNDFGSAVFSEKNYDDYKIQAAEFHELKSKDEYAAFMIKHDLRDEGAEGDVTTEEIVSFEEVAVPEMKEFHSQQPSFEQWKEEGMAEFQAMTGGGPSTVDAVVEELGAMDILFALLGVATAYKLALGGDE